MMSVPLHPEFVHLPLGLAFILPVLAIGFAWALWTGRVRSRAWITIVALQCVLLGAGLIAMNTGEQEEERVERVVPETAIKQHEELAEQFLWATGITLVLAASVLVFPRIRRALTLVTVVGTIAVTASAIRVGHAGGQLVYTHNAGAAYPSGTKITSTQDSGRTGVADRRRDSDDDDGR
jgi:uncharacterized membrane protein